MRKIEITCDQCAADLSVVDSPRDHYRLTLGAEGIRNTSPMRYATDFPPPLRGEHHFCGFDCLASFINGRVTAKGEK